MFRFIAEILVKSKVKRESLQRKKAFLNWQKIEKIALIIEEKDAFSKSEIDAWIKETAKYVEVFYIDLKSKQPQYNDWHCFTRKDKSLLGLPNTNSTNLIKNKQFDLLINTCEESNLFSISLSANCGAQLHCSSSNLYNEADLIVKRLLNQKLLNYLNNVLYYLKMIKT